MLRQLLDISSGLQFLHSRDVIHGDLKGVSVPNIFPITQPIHVLILCFFKDNILITTSGAACLGDFGLSSIASFSCTETSAHGARGTVRWMAPELILPVDEKSSRRSTKESDVYAFAMVAIEVLYTLIPNSARDSL